MFMKYRIFYFWDAQNPEKQNLSSAFFGSWPWPLALDHHDQDDDDYVVTT